MNHKKISQVHSLASSNEWALRKEKMLIFTLTGPASKEFETFYNKKGKLSKAYLVLLCAHEPILSL